MQARTSIIIDQPIDRVFEFVTEVTRMPDWVTGVTGARVASPTMGPGAHFILDYQPGYRETELAVVVEAYEPPRRFGFSTERGPFAFSGLIELESSGTGTRVWSIIEADPDSLSTKVANLLLGPYISRSMVRRLDRELVALAGAIAADPNVRS
jgi:uncharacterized protein YndB with AHSA1/START domain